MSATTARALEETFRPILAAGLEPGLNLRLRNEDTALVLPAVILSAEEEGDFLGVKVAGRCARICALEIEYQIPGSAEESSATAEHLAGALDAIIANAAANVAAVRAAATPEALAAAQAALTAAGADLLYANWLYLRLLDSDKKSEFDGRKRVLTCTFDLHALTAA